MRESAYSSNEDYIYASSRVRFFEKRLLSFEQLRRLFDAESVEEALRLLKETPYGLRLKASDSEADIERVLLEERERLFRELEEAAPESPGLQLLTLEEDYHNLKVLFKKVVLGLDVDHLLLPFHSSEWLYYENILAAPGRNPAVTLREQAIDRLMKDWEKEHDPWRAELILDHGMFQELRELARRMDSEIVDEWIQKKIDFYNLESYLRFLRLGVDASFFRAAFADGGSLHPDALLALYREGREPEEKDYERLGFTAELREACDEYKKRGNPHVIEMLRTESSWKLACRAERLTYGPGVLFGYWLRRELEITALRTLFISLRSNLSREERRARLPLLRDGY